MTPERIIGMTRKILNPITGNREPVDDVVNMAFNDNLSPTAKAFVRFNQQTLRDLRRERIRNQIYWAIIFMMPIIFIVWELR